MRHANMWRHLHGSMSGGPMTEGPWTVTELSRRVGMTVRNIRAHQSRGLIAPPERRGRHVFYGPAHERSLRRIHELQEQGYNLAAIEKMLAGEDQRSSELR